MTAPSLPAALRGAAEGLSAPEAAMGLIIAHGTWLARDDFACFIRHGTGTAAIDGEAAITALDAGALPSSAGEKRMLRLAASLADQAHVSIGDASTSTTSASWSSGFGTPPGDTSSSPGHDPAGTLQNEPGAGRRGELATVKYAISPVISPDNFAADRAVDDKIIASLPAVQVGVRAQRELLGRVVRCLVGEVGLRQLLDIGSGLPTAENVHQIAQQISPATRVVYLDNDPVVLSHAWALLADNTATFAAEGDLKDPAGILANPDVRGNLDWDQPIGLLPCGICTTSWTRRTRPTWSPPSTARFPPGVTSSSTICSPATTRPLPRCRPRCIRASAGPSSARSRR